jgi:hypothetical protein
VSDLLNLLAKGHVPPAVAPYLCSANLLAANKKSGGHRPVAVGETLRRWASKCLAAQATEDCSFYLSPLQLGVRVKGGCEAIIHAVASIFDSEATPLHSKWILQVDFSNAFNMIDRTTLMQEVREKCPKLSAWVEMCYGASSHLFFGNTHLLSLAGAQQGDPLASLLFALALQPLILRLKDTCPELLLNVWFLDDGTLVGSREDLQAALDLLEAERPPRGLHLSHSKSMVWCGDENPSNLDPLDRAASHNPQQEVSLS